MSWSHISCPKLGKHCLPNNTGGEGKKGYIGRANSCVCYKSSACPGCFPRALPSWVSPQLSQPSLPAAHHETKSQQGLLVLISRSVQLWMLPCAQQRPGACFLTNTCLSFLGHRQVASNDTPIWIEIL